MFSRLLWNTILVASLGTFFACILGFIGAMCGCALGPRLRRLAMAISFVVLVLPPFLATNCWLHLLGLAGPWSAWWPFNIYSFAGVIWIFALTFWPIAFLLCLTAWQKLDAPLFEVEPALRRIQLVRWLLWPTARRSMAHAVIITFALQMNQFAVPAILQVKVLPAELWLRMSTQLDFRGALIASIPGLLATFALLFILRGQEVEWPRFKGESTPAVFRRQIGHSTLAIGGAIFILATFASAVLPAGELLLASRTWSDLPKVINAAPMLIAHSALFAGGGALVSMVLALCTWRVRVGGAAWLFFFTPGVLLAASLIFLLNRRGLDMVYGSPAIVILALALRYFAVPWQGTRLATRAADRSLLDVVRLESSSQLALLRHGYWPQIRHTVGAAAYVSYLLALWDVETLILIYPPGGETLALRVFNLLHYGHIGQVNALCLILMALALAPGAVWLCGRWIARWQR